MDFSLSSILWGSALAAFSVFAYSIIIISGRPRSSQFHDVPQPKVTSSLSSVVLKCRLILIMANNPPPQGFPILGRTRVTHPPRRRTKRLVSGVDAPLAQCALHTMSFLAQLRRTSCQQSRSLSRCAADERSLVRQSSFLSYAGRGVFGYRTFV
jgi:hypothetical protein